jgi:hypothetical protein
MALDKEDGGTKIKQPNPTTIKVVEGEGSGRVAGIIFLLGGLILIWVTFNKITDMIFIFGVLVALFGAALATQRFTMTLDRLKGTWSCGGDVFFVIRFHSHGLLMELGPVCIGRRESAIGRRGMSEPVFTHPVSVEGRKAGGGRMELRFGQYWSLEDAQEVSARLAEFLNRSVQDNSAKETQTQ